MEHARGYLRYIFPGFTFAFELWLLLTLSCKKPSVLCVVGGTGFDLSSTLGVAVSSVLILGGIGYFLSTVHHWLLWSIYAWLTNRGWGTLTPDYREFLQDKNPTVWPDPGLAEAWQAVTALWYGDLDSSRPKEATQRTQDLTDISHGAGAALVGAVAAVGSWLIVVLVLDSQPFARYTRGTFGAAVLALLLLIMHWQSYTVTVRHASAVIQQMLAARTDQSPQPPQSGSV